MIKFFKKTGLLLTELAMRSFLSRRGRMLAVVAIVASTSHVAWGRGPGGIVRSAVARQTGGKLLGHRGALGALKNSDGVLASALQGAVASQLPGSDVSDPASFGLASGGRFPRLRQATREFAASAAENALAGEPSPVLAAAQARAGYILSNMAGGAVDSPMMDGGAEDSVGVGSEFGQVLANPMFGMLMSRLASRGEGSSEAGLEMGSEALGAVATIVNRVASQPVQPVDAATGFAALQGLRPAAMAAPAAKPAAITPMATAQPAGARTADLELMAIDLVDSGNADEMVGPRYRVTVRNSSDVNVNQEFAVTLAAAGEPGPSPGLPHSTRRVNGLNAGETTLVDVRLPYGFDQLQDTEGRPLTYLLISVDSHDEVQDTDRDNNFAAVSLDAVPALATAR